MRKGDRRKIIFQKIDEFRKDRLYQWKFLLFELKNISFKSQIIMDRIFIGLLFMSCYIDDIFVFSKNKK